MLFGAALFSRIPALTAPIALDDFAQRGLIEGQLTPQRQAWNLYDFIDQTNHAELVARGIIPWWNDTSGLVARFLRPIPSLLVWLDHRVSGYDGLFPHVHSLLWWMLATGAFFVLVRARFGQRVALLAAAVLAVSPGHTVPVLWPANRAVLVTLTFGCLALLAHLRAIEGSGSRMVAMACWAATFLTGEYALCFFGYVLAIELVRRRERIAHRARSILPFLLAAGAYSLVRAALGYDVREWVFYRNPLEDPVDYLWNSPRAFLVMLGSGWFGIDDVYSRSLATPVLAALLAALVVIVVTALWLTLRRVKPSTRRDAVWLGAGSLLSLVPVLSATASMRVIGVSSLGIAACTGLLLESAVRKASRWGSGAKIRVEGIFRAVVSLAFLFQDFIKIPAAAHAFTALAAKEELEFARKLEWVQKNRPATKSTAIVLRGVTPPTAFVAPYMLRDQAPERFRVLTQAQGRVVVVRVGPNALELLQDGNEPLVHFGAGDRIRARPLTVGENVRVPGMEITIAALDDDGLPKQLHFEFERNLDDPSYWWITEGAEGFREVEMPPITRGIRLVP